MMMSTDSPISVDSHLLNVRRLLHPDCFDHDTGDIRLIETHISWVILTGEYAYKLKKPVDLGFVNFSTLERRLHFCEEELRINRRLAPDFYVGVVPVTGTHTHPRLGGNGNPVDFAVKMREFPQTSILNKRINKGGIGVADIEQIATRIARFHADIAENPSTNGFGDSDAIHHYTTDNAQHLLRLELQPDIRDRLSVIKAHTDEAFAKVKYAMQTRAKTGFVRECHGDLHLRNIALVDGRVVIFDGIDFNEGLRWIDVMSEVGFLFVDLCHHHQRALAWRFLNTYLQNTGDYDGLVLLDYYTSYRAMVRALVSRLQYLETDQDALQQDYLDYISLAEDCFRPRQPRLMLTHGLAGCGKTTVSRQLADECGAIHLRSDLERKRLMAPINRDDSTVAAPEQGIYTADISDRIYEHLLSLTDQLLSADLSVVVDATFLKYKHRAQFRALATKHHVPWCIFDIRAPDQLLEERVAKRAAERSDASDATLGVLAHQRKTQESLASEEEAYVVRVDGSMPFDARVATEAIFRHSEPHTATVPNQI